MIATAIPSPPIVERLLTLKEAAGLLGLSTRTLSNYARDGRLKLVRFGGATRVDPLDLRRFIDEQKTTAPEAEAAEA